MSMAVRSGRVSVKWSVSWLLLVVRLEIFAPLDFFKKTKIPLDSVGKP
jgi:hypothetical protein